MDSKKQKVRALGLCSGGLDSMLAGLVLREQGIEVHWIAFETPFFTAAKARKASKTTGIPLIVRPIFDVYLKMLRNPPAGYGKYMNPCRDCHALMFKLAGEIMHQQKFDFLFSGEVLGQRPLSQNKGALRYVEKRSGLDGYILRPLSAKILQATLPEEKGWVERELLLDIEGRSRKRQMQLAQKFGISDYPSPAGGCLLTDKGFSTRLQDLFAHQDDCTEEELHLLKYGRHFRLNPKAKLIVGRTHKDNEQILKYHNPVVDTVINVKDYPGPTALIPRGAPKNSILLAASICTGYSKAPKLSLVEVEITGANKKNVIQVIAIQPDDVRKLMIT